MRSPLVVVMAASAIAACSITPPQKQPEVGAAIRAPAEQKAYIETFASGVQIYECSLMPGSKFEWTLKAPEATLMDRAGATVGKHYAGPTWEWDDGSSIVGEVKAREPGPDPTAIPWLLLGVKSRTGFGALVSVQNIQRIDTAGGVPPADGCSAASLNRLTRIPYKATYIFYH